MAVLVSSVAQAMQRIREYQKDVEQMSEVMSNNIAWYAMPRGRTWLFGPSKYIGYEKYPGRQKGVYDGRITEGVLQKWSEPVEPGHPKYDELHAALNEFCARFNKKPNARARIGILQEMESSTPGVQFTDELVALMAAVYRGLTPAQKSAFGKQIGS